MNPKLSSRRGDSRVVRRRAGAAWCRCRCLCQCLCQYGAVRGSRRESCPRRVGTRHRCSAAANPPRGFCDDMPVPFSHLRVTVRPCGRAFRVPAPRLRADAAGIKNAYYTIWVLYIPVRARGRRGAEPEATSAPGTRLCSGGGAEPREATSAPHRARVSAPDSACGHDGARGGDLEQEGSARLGAREGGRRPSVFGALSPAAIERKVER